MILTGNTSQAASLLAVLLLSTPQVRPAAKDKAEQQKGENHRKASLAYRVVHGWPILPKGEVLGQVSGVAVDSHNHVFVFHRAYNSVNRTKDPITVPTILCFDGKTGKLLASWGKNIFVIPHGLRIDRADNVWVTDVGTHQVFKFSHDGKQLMVLGEKNVPGDGGRHFNMPTDVAFASDGSFYVGDGYGNSRVAKFSKDGHFLLDWGKKGENPGEFNLPHSVAVASDGRVYVCDRANGRIQIFTPKGEFIEQWKSAELGRPWSLEIGADGYIYVVDGGDMVVRGPDRASIMKLDRKGKILEKWSSFGNQEGQLFWGHDLTVGKDGAIYVGDVYYGMRVQKFARTDKDFLYLPR
jgi:DNA-binding beta-propeller fold protein YncE